MNLSVEKGVFWTKGEYQWHWTIYTELFKTHTQYFQFKTSILDNNNKDFVVWIIFNSTSSVTRPYVRNVSNFKIIQNEGYETM